MLSYFGLSIIVLFLLLIWRKKVSVMVGLVLVPVVLGLLAGFSPTNLGEFALKGIQQVMPTAVLLMFAVLYFSVMYDAGLFSPIISRILKFVKGDPLKVIVGTALLTMVAHLDGDGTTTFMITITAFLPIYKKLGIPNLVLAGIVALSVGPMHLVPWSGTSARVLAVYDTAANEVFLPNIPAMLMGIIWVLGVAVIWGLRERKRLGVQDMVWEFSIEMYHKPHLLWVNALLTLFTLACLFMNLMPASLLFLVAGIAALQLNYPKLNEQKEVLQRHGNNIFLVVSVIVSAGVFSGILSGSGMIDAMAHDLVTIVPSGNSLVWFTAITSMPASILFTPDAYYFGILPVLKESAAQLNMETIQLGRAALLGQMTVGFPLSPLTASTLLLVGLAEVDLADHQKHTFLWAWGTTLIMTLTAFITGSIGI